MRPILLVSLALALTACLPGSTPAPTGLEPASSPQTATSPPAEDTPVVDALPITPTSTVPLTEVPTTASTVPNATGFPNPSNYAWEIIVSGLERPVDVQSAGDERLFIVEKAGRIRILQDGDLFDSPFLDITDRVGSRSNEQGLLGLAFHPNYAENGYFFVNYTDVRGDTMIARFQVISDENAADPSSEMVLLRADQPYSNHNGGAVAFGPDGYLYLGLGDGGSAGDPQNNGQKLDTFLGKILRLDVDSAEPYAIPPDNPFGSEIWAYGLRNPWRISFDQATGNLFIGDVGQNQWEEIDFVASGSPGGLNFGWKFFEGNHAFDGTPPGGTQLVAPIAEYDHSQGCSVTGGHVYRGGMTEWNGVYFFGDYCTETVWGLIQSDEGWQNQILFGAGGNITSFGQDSAGEIYIATDQGQILRLQSLDATQ